MAKNNSSSSDLYLQMQRALICALLADGDEVGRVLELVKDDDFTEPSLQAIFNAVVSVFRTDNKVSAISVGYQLEANGLLAKVGGAPALYAMIEEGRERLMEAPVIIYARIVKESSAKSKIKKMLEESLPTLKDDSGVSAVDATGVLMTELNKQLFDLSDDSTVVEVNKSSEQYLDLLAERARIAAENAENAEGLQGIPTMWPSLNKYTSGLAGGQLWIVGGRPGVGKSVAAVDFAVAAAKANKSVMFFSLEMSERELQDRIVASISGVSLNDLKQGRITEENKPKLTQALKELSQMKILIDTDVNVTVDAIQSRAMRRAESPEGLDLIICDYLQLLTPPTGRKTGSRQEDVSNISRSAKIMAKNLNVPVIMAVQLKRPGKDDESSLPKLEDIRESGSIEQDADVVLLLHRDTSFEESESIPQTLFILAKQRGGEANKIIRCHSLLAFSLFKEIKKAKDVDNNYDDVDGDFSSLDGDNDDFSDEINDDFDDDFDLDDIDIEV